MSDNMEYYNKLKSVPQTYLKKIEAGRLKGMSDIKPQWRVQILTEVFGMCGVGWKYEIVSVNFSEKDSLGQIACFVTINLYVKVGNEWSAAIPGVGGSTFIANEKNGLYMSDEVVKMAMTDAISVATKMIGVAADVYMGHGGKYDGQTEKKSEGSDMPQTPPIQNQYKEDNRPWISDKQTLESVALIKGGDTAEYERCNKDYRMSKVNRQKLIDAKG